MRSWDSQSRWFDSMGLLIVSEDSIMWFRGQTSKLRLIHHIQSLYLSRRLSWTNHLAHICRAAYSWHAYAGLSKVAFCAIVKHLEMSSPLHPDVVNQID